MMSKSGSSLLRTAIGSFFLLTGFLYVTAQETPPALPPMTRPARIVSPEIHPDNTVTFRVSASKSDTVRVNGDWEGGRGITMTQDTAGIWSVTVGPLEPEFYGYVFIVDSVQVLDPLNPLIKRDGTRNASQLLVPGEGSDLYAVKDVPHGILSKVWYPSPTLNLIRRMYVYTPPGYENSADRYPVFYLLHGGGGDEDAWTTLGRAPHILDNLIAQGKAKPMIVVMTNGNPTQTAAPGEGSPNPISMEQAGSADMGSGKFEESLMKDVVPYIDSHYRTIANKENRALAGLSMGGIQTMNISFNHPDFCDYIGVMSMGLVNMGPERTALYPDVDNQIEALKKSGYKLYWIGCGVDDFLYQSAKDLVTALDKHQFKYIYRESTGGHTWANWRIYLSELATLLFK